MSDFGGMRQVVTRKPHRCVYCSRDIPIGVEACNYKGKWQEDWQNWYSCSFCNSTDEISAFTGEEISGDEFTDWLWNQEFSTCLDCGSKYTTVDHDWSKDQETVEFECTGCGKVWSRFIGFKAGGEEL